MPSRIIREGINSSDRVNALSPLAELFYRRLLNVVDDYGRYFGSAATLRAACWPTNPEKVTEKQVSQWLSECLASDSQLLIRYRSGQSTYVQVCEFRQQVRSKSKFPDPAECEAVDEQMQSTCETNVHASRISYSEGVSRIPNMQPDGWFVSEFWPLWPVKENKAAAEAAAGKLSETEQAEAIRGIREQATRIKSQDRPIHASTWLNGKRWLDEPHAVEAAGRRNATGPLFAAYESPTDRAIRIGHERILKDGKL